MKKETKKAFEDIRSHQDIANATAELNRARSLTVGTAFGGTTEISMRANDGSHLWCVMQPVEVIELIHQLASNVGCHIALKPREDFSSWREWRISEAEKKHLNGWPPFVNDMSVFSRVGISGFDQQAAELAIAHDLAQKEYEYVNGGARIKEPKNEPVAIKKTVKRRSTKRAATTA